MRHIVRLGRGADFQLAMALGSPIIPVANSTIQEIFNNSEAIPFQPTTPTVGMEYTDDYNYQTDSRDCRIQYVAIGCKGHYNIDGATHGIPGIGTYEHKATDTGFFQAMPFVIRDIDDDLSPDDRKDYAGRKTLMIGGALKVAYFLRRVDFSSYARRQEIKKTVGGVTQSQPFEPSINDLLPKPKKQSGTNDGTYLSTFIDFTLSFDATQSAWVREAAELLYGDVNAAIISEIAVCHGVDKPITKRYPNTGDQIEQPVTTQLTEAVWAQITIIESTHMALTFANGFIAENFSIGTEDPLYGNNFKG